MNVKNPITLDQFITQLTKLKNRVGGDIPVVLEGRDTVEIPCKNSTGGETTYRLAVLIADDIETLYGDCDSLGKCAWVRGFISANGFKRPCEVDVPDSGDGDDGADSDNSNLNLDGVVGDSNTNIPPCWRR